MSLVERRCTWCSVALVQSPREACVVLGRPWWMGCPLHLIRMNTLIPDSDTPVSSDVRTWTSTLWNPGRKNRDFMIILGVASLYVWVVKVVVMVKHSFGLHPLNIGNWHFVGISIISDSVISKSTKRQDVIFSMLLEVNTDLISRFFVHCLRNSRLSLPFPPSSRRMQNSPLGYQYLFEAHSVK